MNKNNYRKSFTLLELLVVVAVIGILATILLPSLSKSRTLAMRAVCLSNTKQWGYGITQITIKNNGIIPYMSYTVGRYYPYAMQYDSDEKNLNVEDMNEAMGGDGSFYNTSDYSMSEAALCPSAGNSDVFDYFNNPDIGHTFYPDRRMVLTMYQYFGHSQDSDPKDENPNPDDILRRNRANELLIERELAPDRIMLTDFTLRNNAGRRWFNHDNSEVELVNGSLQTADYMNVVGINRLWGDGSARWHYFSDRDRTLMNQENPSEIPYFRTTTDNSYFGSESDLPE